MTVAANMQLVGANTVNLALEEMVSRGQIASTSITQHFERWVPILQRDCEIDYRKYVDFTLRRQFG